MKFWDGWFFGSPKPFFDASWYKGTWRNGLREGHGTGHYRNAGMEYSGEWNEDLFHGNGKLTLNNGDVIEGQWLNGCHVGI